jgi:hypothetical protein
MGVVGRFGVMSVVRSGKRHARGVHRGLRDVLAGPRDNAAPPVIRRKAGSPATDRDARRRDVARFGGDVERREPVALSK